MIVLDTNLAVVPGSSTEGKCLQTLFKGGIIYFHLLSDSKNICKMIEFLIDHIFVQLGGCLFGQIIGIPIGINCVPLLADLFLCSYDNEFLDNIIRSGHRRLARSFNYAIDTPMI